MARYSAITIAKWFLATNKIEVAENGADLISNLKLQKLLYYSQGCYLGLKGKALFNDDIVAWKHGPVVESIYHTFKDYGACGITFDEPFDFNTIDEETTEILTEVYDTFGQFSAWKLREMTHQEDPWIDVNQNEVISTRAIKNYFIEHYIS